jgi:hypothetical protein
MLYTVSINIRFVLPKQKNSPFFPFECNAKNVDKIQQLYDSILAASNAHKQSFIFEQTSSITFQFCKAPHFVQKNTSKK